MKVIDTEISGLKIIEPDVFGDSRGWFCETYNAERYRRAGIGSMFVQYNESPKEAQAITRWFGSESYPSTAS